MWRITALDQGGQRVASIEVEGGEVTIGREVDRQLVIPSPSVSRKHARLILDGAEPVIIDEDSANGVLVNGVRISQPTPIITGMRVDLAEFRLEWDYLAPTEAVKPIDDLRPPPSAGPFQSLRLVAEGGPFDGRVSELAPLVALSVGRAAENDLVFDDPSLSRKHCRLRQVASDRIEVEDLDSSNGTFVNDRRVERGTALAGDALRFGELRFRIEGETALHSFTPRAAAPPRSFLFYGAVGLGVALVFGGVTLLIMHARSNGPEGRDAIARIAEQAEGHVRAGRERLADRAFAAAQAEFEQAIALDPANAEARRSRSLAAAEPQNERLAQQIRVRGKLAIDRATLAQVLPLLAQIPSESAFREPTAKDLAQRLTSFGELQCKAKRWADCAWAICKAREVGPASARPVTTAAAAEAALREAERRLARDRSYTPCSFH